MAAMGILIIFSSFGLVFLSTAKVVLDHSIGTFGGLVVDGLPFIPSGSFEDIATFKADQGSLKFLEETGNIVSPYTQTKSGVGLTDEYFDVLARRGIMAFVHLPFTYLSPSNASKRALLTDIVNKLKVHPAVLGYYIADEPDGGKAKPPFTRTNPHTLDDTYSIIKAADPDRPIIILVNNPAAMPYFINGSDVSGSDPYPCAGAPNYLGPVSIAGSQAAALAKFGHPFMITPYAFGGSVGCERFATPAEEKVMGYLAMIQGSIGLQWFIHRFRYGPSQSWNAVLDVGNEVAEMTMSIMGPRPSTNTAPSAKTTVKGLALKAFLAAAGYIDVIVANTLDRPANFKLTLLNGTKPIADASAEVLFQNRHVSIVSSTLSDFIDGFGTRAYRILPSDAAGASALRLNGSGLVNPNNCMANPSFEQSFSTGFPDGLGFVWPQDGIANASLSGASVHVDVRTAVDGLHSLRLVAPSAAGAVELMPMFCDPKQPKSKCTYNPSRGTHELSVWAKGATDGLGLQLSLLNKIKNFTLSTQWMQISIRGRACISCVTLKQSTAGMIWLDLMQLVPVSGFEVAESSEHDISASIII